MSIEKSDVETRVDNDVRAKFTSGLIHLFFWGYIEYQDAFGNSRYTRFCLQNDNLEQQMTSCENNNNAN